MRAASHGERAYRAGCRCDTCRAWRAHANAVCRARRAAGLDKTTNPSHGTERRFAAGCRCRKCTSAGKHRAARAKKHNAARYAALTPEQKHAAYLAQRQTMTPEQRRAYAAKWRDANREKTRAYMAKWRADHRDDARNASRAWRAEHREEARAQQQQWRAQHPEKTAEYRATHRAKQQRRAQPDLLTATLSAVLPTTLPDAIRADVCQDLAIVWLETGTITRDDVRAAITANWRMVPVMAGRDISLSTPVTHDNDRITLADRLVA